MIQRKLIQCVGVSAENMIAALIITAKKWQQHK